MSLFWPHRVKPLSRTTTIEDRRGTTWLRYVTGDPASYIFTADIYAYCNNAHPDGHLGWWRFELPRGAGTGALHFDFAPIRRESVWLTVNGARAPLIDTWYNPEYAFDPLADLQLVFRDPQGRIRRIDQALLKFVDRDILRSFYRRQYATEGYSPGPNLPFLPELHLYKLRKLDGLFKTYIPAGGRVVDVGCGRSLFSELCEFPYLLVPLGEEQRRQQFPFKVFSGDLDYESVHTRAAAVPYQAWSVFDAAAVPFGDEQVDALFAGEVIEHMPDVGATLREWHRVLKPGGIAIVTTPNRGRLLAIVDRRERPYSPDHLSELSYRELTRRLLPEAGFDFVTQSCLYLELWLKNVWSSRRVEDHLQSEGNRPEYLWLMKRLYPLGRFLPWVSLATIVVARKRADGPR